MTDAPLALGPNAIVVATAPIGMLCDDALVVPTEVVPGLWFVDLGALGCQTVARAADPIALPEAAAMVLSGGSGRSDHERVVAVRRRSGGGWRLVVVLAGDGRPELRRGSQLVRLRAAAVADPWSTATRWVASLPRRGARDVVVRVRGAESGERVAALHLP